MSNEILYEINYHYSNTSPESFHCTVTPIIVLREGILPGCTKSSITARDATGRKFYGNRENYYATEKEAWGRVHLELTQSISNLQAQKEEIEKSLTAQSVYLYSLISATKEIE